MTYQARVGVASYHFADLRELMAKASPLRSGDQLAGIAAGDARERVATCQALADVPLARFLNEAVVPYEQDDITRLIVDGHDASAFLPVAHLSVGAFRDWLLSDIATSDALSALAPGLTPEMVAAVSKQMRNQDLILVASRCLVVTAFARPWACPATWPHGCNRTTRPTARWASPPASSTA